jgi:hypothetical protein
MPKAPVVADHFEGCQPNVQATYAALMAAARALGAVKEEPKKTSIHLVRSSAFAGVSTRKSALVLTLKSTTDIKSPRISKREQASPNRWHLEVKIESPKEIDREIRTWLNGSYEIS